MAAAAGILQAIVGLGQIGISATQLAREGKAMRKLREQLTDSEVPSQIGEAYSRAKTDAMTGMN